MKTPDGYFVLDAALVEKLLQQQRLTRSDLLAAGIHAKSIRKLRTRQPVQRQTVFRLFELLRLDLDSRMARRLMYGDSSRQEAVNAICLASWTPDGSSSAWKTAGNGLRYRVQMLKHLHTAGKRGRGKCYDLSQFDDQARQRIEPVKSRHSDVLQRLKRKPAFPCHAESGYSDENHFWVIDDYEEGLTLTEYLNRDELSGRSLPFAETMDIMAQIAAALLEMHEVNVIRRELTPDSILIQADGHVLLTDLELCKLLGEHPTVVPGKLPRSTWLAPELGGMPTWNAADVAEWGTVDVYSWGKIFLNVATGRVPPVTVGRADTEIPGYSKGVRHLLSSATFAGYRSRPSMAQALGALLETGGSEGGRGG